MLRIIFLTLFLSVFSKKRSINGEANDPFESFSHFKFSRSIQLTPKIYEGCDNAWTSGYRYQATFPILFSQKDDVPNWRFVVCNNTNSHSSTVILFRRDGSESFERSFTEYEEGFDSPKTDYFIGLKRTYELAKQGFNELRITLVNQQGQMSYISYPFFRLKSAPYYSLGLSSPSEGDLPDDLFDHRNLPFLAPSKEYNRTDGINCAGLLKAGWWFHPTGNCASALLTGSFAPRRGLCRARRPFPLCNGVYWSDWNGFHTLNTVVMEVRKKMT